MFFMRILLIESHALFREGLKRVLSDIEPACAFIEAGATRDAGLAPQKGVAFDAMLFDARLVSCAEIVVCRGRLPHALLLAFINGDDHSAGHALLAAGVDALVPRSVPLATLAAALRVALAGDICVRGSLPAGIVHPWIGGNVAAAKRGRGPLNLTVRQYDVLALLAQGRANQSIADELGIGVRTVKGHVSVVLRALHADNRVDARRVARRWLAHAVMS
jgi:DNA-binding NarL/FixJ family response regulator